jgi:hypothetical protein
MSIDHKTREWYNLRFLERGALLRKLQTLVCAERCSALRSNFTTAQNQGHVPIGKLLQAGGKRPLLSIPIRVLLWALNPSARDFVRTLR